MRNLFIAICGSSGSGKTTLAKELAAHYESIGIESQIISLDDFYKDGLANDPNVNWDDPSTFDHEAFFTFLKSLQENGTAESPIYDFVTSSRMRETKTITRVKVNIVEGIFSHHPAIEHLFHAKIFVDTDLDLCLARRRERDVRERGRTETEVNAAWHQNVLPKYYEFIDPCKKNADVIVENSQSTTDHSTLQFHVKPVVQYLDQLLRSVDIANTRLSQMRFTLLPKVEVRPIIDPVDELLALFRTLPEAGKQRLMQELLKPSQAEIDSTVAIGNGRFTAADIAHMDSRHLLSIERCISSMQPGPNGEPPLFRISDISRMDSNALHTLVRYPALIEGMRSGRNGEPPLFNISDLAKKDARALFHLSDPRLIQALRDQIFKFTDIAEMDSFALRELCNSALLQAIKNREIGIEQVAFMHSTELNEMISSGNFSSRGLRR